MKKRYLSFMVGSVLAIGMLAGCGKQTAQEDGEKSNTVSEAVGKATDGTTDAVEENITEDALDTAEESKAEETADAEEENKDAESSRAVEANKEAESKLFISSKLGTWLPL